MVSRLQMTLKVARDGKRCQDSEVTLIILIYAREAALMRALFVRETVASAILGNQSS